MRQTNKYYWVKRFPTSTHKEVAFLGCDGLFYLTGIRQGWHKNDFCSIDDEPLEVPKIQVELKNRNYYVIDLGNNEKVVAKYFAGNNTFDITGTALQIPQEQIKVIGGPFTIEELVQIKPLGNV